MNSTNSILIAVGLVGLAIAALLIAMALRLGRSSEARGKPPYFTRTSLISEVELVLYRRLVAAFPGHHVFCQVHLPRVIDVGAKGPEFWRWFNPIKLLSLDFLVCAPDMSPLLAIELDDKSHDQPERKGPDQRKNESLDAAGLRLVRIKTSELSSIKNLAEYLKPPEPLQTA